MDNQLKIKNKMNAIKLLLLDVDGVLTNGEIVLGGEDQEFKIYNVQDGLGIKLLSENGVQVGILTGRMSDAVKKRAKELNIKILCQGYLDKPKGFREILNRHHLNFEDVCYVGDDLLDIPVMKKAGFSIAVANGRDEVKAVADFVTVNQGGKGAVREVAELILKSQGKWESIVNRFKETEQ